MTGVPEHPELLLRERAWLRALARQLVRPDEGADELAHDAITAAMTQPLARTVGLRGWLAAILKKQLAGRRRAEHRRRARETLAARTDAVPPAIDTVARFEVQRDVGNAVLALSEPYRTTVLLRFWEELSPAAIAKRMGVPVETVRTRLRRGLAQLRERLDRAHGGDRSAWALPLAGMALMTTSGKLVVGGLAVAAAAWLLIATPWAPPREVDLPAVATSGDAVASLVAQPARDSATSVTVREPATVEHTVRNEADAAWLEVTGTVVDDATGTPLRDVPVRLVCWPATGVDVDTTTAADGVFVLHDARPPGRDMRQVVVLAADYAAVHVDPFVTKGPQQKVEVGTVRLVRGTMFSGVVVDQDGQGVTGAELLLPLDYTYYGGHGPQDMLHRAASLGHADAGGRFRLEQPVAPGDDHQNLLFAVAARGIGWCTFEPSKQRREVADLVIALRPTGSMRVLVEDPTGRPFAGALVRALPRFGPLGIARGGWRKEVSLLESVRAHFVGRTDAKGELLLPHLPMGERDAIWHSLEGTSERAYQLWVEADGHPEQSLFSFELQPAAEQRITVRLVGPREVVVSVDVRDDLGAPILGALVTVGGVVQVEGRTDAAGHVELAIAASPRLSVVATSPGHRRAHSPHDLGSGPASLQVALVLARTQSLDGRVVDQAGAPVAGMAVFVDNHTDHRIVGTTDADGRFHTEDFPMGLQPIGVALGPGMDPSAWTGEQEPKQVDAAQGPVTIVMQRRLGSIDVRVAIVDAATGEALEPIETYLGLHTEVPEGFFVLKRTQFERGLVMAKGTPAGRWRLSVRTATGQRGSLEFTLTDGQPPTDLRLELPAPGTITGRLQFVGVTPPAEVTLDVRHATLDRTSFVQFRYPGRWQVDPASQSVVDAEHGGTGSLRLQPAQNMSFRLDSADPTDALVFTVRGEGITGRATVRVEPGQTRELVVEVTAKAK